MQFFPAKQQKVQFSFTNSANTQQSNSTLPHIESKTRLEFQKPISEINPSHTNSKPTKQFKLWAQHTHKNTYITQKNWKIEKWARKNEPQYHQEEGPWSLRSLWTMHESDMLTTLLLTFSHMLKTFSLSPKRKKILEEDRQTDRQRKKRSLRILNKKDLRGILIWSTPRKSYYKMLWGQSDLETLGFEVVL